MQYHGTRSGIALSAALLLSAFAGVEQTQAETATNLKCRGCVGGKDIGRKAVRSKHIKDGTILPADLHQSARPGGLDFASGQQLEPVGPGSGEVVRAVTVTAPADGRVMVVATWGSTDQAGGLTSCSVTTGTTLDTTHQVITRLSADITSVPSSAVRSFDVDPGDTTFNLVCVGDGGESISNSSMSALFVPGAV